MTEEQIIREVILIENKDPKRNWELSQIVSTCHLVRIFAPQTYLAYFHVRGFLYVEEFKRGLRGEDDRVYHKSIRLAVKQLRELGEALSGNHKKDVVALMWNKIELESKKIQKTLTKKEKDRLDFITKMVESLEITEKLRRGEEL